MPIHLVSESAPGAAVVAIRKVDKLGFYTMGMRKLASVSGWAKHAVIYEFTSREGREKYFRAHEHRDPKQSAWTREVIAKLVHAPGSPNATSIW